MTAPRGTRAGVLAAATLAIALLGLGEASAATNARRVPPGPGSPEYPDKKAAKPPVGPVLAVVSLARQRISVYGSAGLIAQGAVSSGRPGFPTPTGVFTVIQKNRFHRSNIYSGAPMPYMQRITWSGVALHAGVLPGYPASHGCIRLSNAFAMELWGITKLGARVVVTPDDAQAAEIASARLPVPALTNATSADALPDAAPIKTVSLTAAAGDGDTTDAAPPVRLVNPLERAKAAKIATAVEAASKAKAAKQAVELSAAKALEANKAIAALREAESVLAAARARLDAADKVLEAAKTPEAIERAKAGQAAAHAKVDEAAKLAVDAAVLEAEKTPLAFAAARAAWEAEKESEAAAAAQKAADRGTEPISIFISRKTGRVYIRQAWAPIHEAPVTFKDPDAAVGTHLYLAVEPVGEGKALRWLSVSMPGAAPAESKTQPRRGDKPAAPARSHETAQSVLDRVEMSEETRAFISQKLWTGASLIVSDQGISHETGTYTDFVVLAR